MWSFSRSNSGLKMGQRSQSCRALCRILQETARAYLCCQDHPAKVLSALIPLMEDLFHHPGSPCYHSTHHGEDGAGESQRRAHSFYTVSTANDRIYVYVCMCIHMNTHIHVRTHVYIAYKSHKPGWHTTGCYCTAVQQFPLSV